MSSSSPSTLLSKSLRSAPSNPTRTSPSISASRGEPSSSSPNALSTPSRPTRARAQAVLATAAASPEAEAGPSTRHALNSLAQDGIGREESASDGSPAKGKGKAPAKPEKRVLPARIRRAAGGGAEGIRDLEEMIVDWLERWGAPLTSPPDNLPIILTTLPLPLVDPPTTTSHAAEPAPPAITLTPTRTHRALTTPSPRAAAAVLETSGRIEVPDWVMVRAGEDDREEAKEELMIGMGRGAASPVKRLRKAILGDEFVEDTSDAYYATLHRKFEVFERRQRIREKEKLQFERYKMRSRIDLLRGMSAPAWIAVVSTVLSRAPHPAASGSDTHHGDGESASERGLSGLSGVGPRGDGVWAKGREKIRVKGVEWLRSKLVREGEEVMKRYDQLLPNESKKQKADSRTSTPTPSMRSPSLSPAPVLPPRVAALRDATSLPKKRTTSPSGSGSKVSTPGSGGRVGDVSLTSASNGRRGQAGRTRTYSQGRKRQRETSSDEEEEVQNGDADVDMEIIPSRPSRVAKTNARRRASQGLQMEVISIVSDSPSPPRSATGRSQSFAPSPSPPLSRSLSVSASASASATPDIDRSQPSHPHAVSSSTTHTRSRTPFFPPLTASGLPILVEAASRREESIAEATASRDKVAAGRVGRLIAREKTRASTRLGLVSPFGMPFPAPVEWKSEFTLSDEEDFWPIIADREAQANHIRRSSLLLASPALSAQPTTSVSASSASVRGTGTSITTGEGTGTGAESGGLMVALEPVSADEAREMREVEAAVVL